MSNEVRGNLGVSPGPCISVFHKIVTACMNFNKSSRSPFRVLSTSLAKCWFSDDTCSFMCCCTLRRTWKFSALLYLGSWNGESGPKKVSFNREVISEIEAMSFVKLSSSHLFKSSSSGFSRICEKVLTFSMSGLFNLSPPLLLLH